MQDTTHSLGQRWCAVAASGRAATESFRNFSIRRLIQLFLFQNESRRAKSVCVNSNDSSQLDTDDGKLLYNPLMTSLNLQ